MQNKEILLTTFNYTLVKGTSRDNSIDIDLILQSDCTINVFGYDLSCFCVTSNELYELKILSTSMLNYLYGDYVLIEIHSNSSPYIGIMISYDYLKSQIHIPSLSLFNFTIQEIMKSIKSDFLSNVSMFSIKFLNFHRDFNKSSFKYVLLQSYCIQFIYDFFNHYESKLIENKNSRTQSLETQKIRDVIYKITSELYKTPPTVQEMALKAEMSISKFKVLFDKEFGVSPHQYILNWKLATAKDLLCTGEYSISQVSYKIGFSHPSGFTRLFKQRFNYSPNKLVPKDLL
jgi:AraC-like DNA-binding protein